MVPEVDSFCILSCVMNCFFQCVLGSRNGNSHPWAPKCGQEQLCKCDQHGIVRGKHDSYSGIQHAEGMIVKMIFKVFNNFLGTKRKSDNKDLGHGWAGNSDLWLIHSSLDALAEKI